MYLYYAMYIHIILCIYNNYGMSIMLCVYMCYMYILCYMYIHVQCVYVLMCSPVVECLPYVTDQYLSISHCCFQIKIFLNANKTIQDNVLSTLLLFIYLNCTCTCIGMSVYI